MNDKNLNPSQNLQKKIRFEYQEQSRPLQGWKKWFLVLLAFVSGIYVFIPELTDAFPFFGWLDEGIAIIIFTYALNKLGIRIPLFDKILTKKSKKYK